MRSIASAKGWNEFKPKVMAANMLRKMMDLFGVASCKSLALSPADLQQCNCKLVHGCCWQVQKQQAELHAHRCADSIEGLLTFSSLCTSEGCIALQHWRELVVIELGAK